MDGELYGLCQAFFSDLHSVALKESENISMAKQEQTAQDSIEAEIGILEQRYGILDGQTIEITLSELLVILPRKRRRTDAYTKIVRRLANEKNCNLKIKNKKGNRKMKKIFIGGNALNLSPTQTFENELDALMTSRLGQDVQTTVDVSGNDVIIHIPVGLKDGKYSPDRIPEEVVWLLLDYKLPVSHFPGMCLWVDQDEFAKLYMEEAKSAKASKVKSVNVDIQQTEIILTVTL